MPENTALEELAFYTLAGQPRSSRDLVGEVRAGEAMGLGKVFISERYDKKEADAPPVPGRGHLRSR